MELLRGSGQAEHPLDLDSGGLKNLLCGQNCCTCRHDVINKPDLRLRTLVCAGMVCPFGRYLVQLEAAVLVSHSLPTVQTVLAHRGATTLQQLKCRSFQAAAHQVWQRIRPALALPAGYRNKQTVWRQITRNNSANRLQRVNVVIPAQRQNELAHCSSIPGGGSPGQWAHTLHRRVCKTQVSLAGLADIGRISFREGLSLADRATWFDQQLCQTALDGVQQGQSLRLTS